MSTSRLKSYFESVPATRIEKWTSRVTLVFFMVFFTGLGVIMGSVFHLLQENKGQNYVDRERAWCEAVHGRVYNYYTGVCYTGTVAIPKKVSTG